MDPLNEIVDRLITTGLSEEDALHLVAELIDTLKKEIYTVEKNNR